MSRADLEREAMECVRVVRLNRGGFGMKVQSSLEGMAILIERLVNDRESPVGSAAWRAGASSCENELRLWRGLALEREYLLELAINGLRMNDRADRMEVEREIGQQTGILPKPKPDKLIEAAMEVVRMRELRAAR